ncbi:ATP-grasp domain-containing protein [Vibrio cholerae]|nr:ATP-grasp domain-containing protein [Vibrio cholerae]
MSYSVLITGAGSVMGQSIYKALANSDFAKDIDLIFVNSLEINAGFEFQSLNCGFKSQVNLICPFAKNLDYVPFIKKIVEKYDIKIIYPGTQHELNALSELNKQLGIIACPNSLTAKNCLDKANTTEILELHGIQAPKSIRVSHGIPELYPASYPVILKPNSSSASRNIFKCESEFQLNNALMEYKNLGIKDAVIQSYIEGPEITCGVYLDKFNKEVYSICFDRILTEDGASLYGEVIDDTEIKKYLGDVVRSFQLSSDFEYGHINVQLRNTAEGPMLFEINGRLSSTEAPKSMLGFNSVEAYFYNIVLGMPYDKFSPKIGRKFIRYYEEIYF